MSIISLKNVEKIFNPGKPNEFTGLRDLTLDLENGQATIIAGPSGSGKTTLLALIGLMSRPTAGRITILGKETTLLGDQFRTLFRRKHIGFIFQHFQLISDLKVRENLDLVLYPEGIPFKHIRDKRSQLLEKFGLLSKADSRTSVLSGGEKQRLAIARALMNDPEILLVDEPTAHLDTALSRDVLSLFLELKSDGRTFVIASHDPLVLGSDLAERVINLRDGSVVEEG
ncbi:MAG: ABC transporter ATP-binding protein [Thermodesulfobacteriota bacterium]